MLLGIDVGGTFTDAVLLAKQKIVATAKSPTTHQDISLGLLEVLEKIMQLAGAAEKISRVALSTTIITNAVSSQKLPEVRLYAIPGPGVNIQDAFPVKPTVLAGYTDHRGKLVSQAPFPADQKIKSNLPAVVSAKFSVRNPQSELLLAAHLKENSGASVICAHEMSGELGFIRRTNSAYYTAATSQVFTEFMQKLALGLEKYKIKAPLYLLKADGGTTSRDWLSKHTCEAYFTGPAASVMGIKALINPQKRCISLDIGGTTTDIAFWENSLPLFARKGAQINNFPTAVRAIHLRSLPIGGDSLVKRSSAGLEVGPERLGPAMALGGTAPTLADAFLVLGWDNFGDLAKAKKAMLSLTLTGEQPQQTAQAILDKAVLAISKVIQEMLAEYALQPVYRVEDVVQAREFFPELLIGVGGAARGLVPALAKHLQLDCQIPANALVANAIGAAVARPTLTADLRADTVLGECILPQAAKKWEIARDFTLLEAQNILHEHLKTQAEKLGFAFQGTEVIWQEEFPVLRDSWHSGNVFNLAMQLKPGVLFSLEGAEN